MSRRHCRHVLAAAVVSSTSLLLSTDVSAVPRTWLGASGNWNTPTLWTGNILPGLNDDAFVFNGDISTRIVTQDAGFVQIQNLTINNSSQIGTNIVDVPSSNSINATKVNVGTTGKSELHITGGAVSMSGGSFTSGGLFMSTTLNGRGVVNMTSGVVNVGTNSSSVIGQLGFASFNQSGGSANWTSLTLGEGTLGSGTYNLSGAGSMNAGTNHLVAIGGAGFGRFIQSAGAVNVSKMQIGQSATGTGTYQLSGGNLNISTNAQFDSAELVIAASGHATFEHTAGSLRVTSPRVGFAGLQIGLNSTSAGTYLLSGTGELNMSGLGMYVGYDGQGTFLQSAGSVAAELIILGGGAGTGRYVLSGSGSSITAPEGLSVSSGSMTQNAGTVKIGNAPGILGEEVAGQLTVSGLYELSGGTINTYGAGLIVNFMNSGPGIFNQTGGVNDHTGVLFVGDVDGLAVGATGTYLLSGGRLNVTPEVIEGGLFGQYSLNGLQLDTGGTIVGGVTDGVFAGKMTQKGGTIAGTFRNEGHIVCHKGFVTGALLNRNRLTMNNGTLTVGSIAISNEAQALIDGAGTVSGAVNNIGRIAPTGALAITTIENTTPATIEIAPNTSLRVGFINNDNTIRLNGGSLLGSSGQISNNATNGGALISGGGMIEPQLVMNGGTVRADLPAVPVVIQSLNIQSAASQFVVATNSTMRIQPNFVNGALINLQGNGALMQGGAITNASTITGAGQISNRVLNLGTIRPQGGELILAGANNTNASDGQLLIGTGNILMYSSGLANNAGLIQLSGGEFNNNGFTLTNSGRINGRGTLRAASISNTGSVLFSGGISDVFGAVTNTGQVTVTGNGAATFFDNFTNTGAGNVSVTLGSTAVFLGGVSGLSTMGGTGAKDFESIASAGAINATGTTIVGPMGNVTTNFIRDNTLDLHGRLTINPNGTTTGASRLGTLLIDGDATPTGTLNLSNNDLILTNGNKSLIGSQIAFARNGGAWNRAGITSSAAASATPKNTTLGVLSGQQYRSVFGPGAQFDGFTVADADVLVKYTYYGDSDFNGTVNFDDYARIDAGLNNGGNEWFEGDFDLNGTVNFDDYALIDLAFNSQSGTLRRATDYVSGDDRSLNGMNANPALVKVALHFEQFGTEYATSFLAAVPEPASAVLCGAAATFGAFRRCRHRRRD